MVYVKQIHRNVSKVNFICKCKVIWVYKLRKNLALTEFCTLVYTLGHMDLNHEKYLTPHEIFGNELYYEF